MAVFFHADPVKRSTRGNRGTTTQRRSTHTVTGPEGEYIAQVKNELLEMPPWAGFVIYSTRAYPNGRVGQRTRCGSYVRTMALAEADIARWEANAAASVKRHGEAYREQYGTAVYEIVPVTVRWVWENGQCVEQETEQK